MHADDLAGQVCVCDLRAGLVADRAPPVGGLLAGRDLAVGDGRDAGPGSRQRARRHEGEDLGASSLIRHLPYVPSAPSKRPTQIVRS
jgi:hypothetical protein